MDFINAISNLVKGFEMKKGSIILLNFWGENRDLDILDKFAVEIVKEGGIPIRYQHSRELNKKYFEEASEESLDFPDKFFEIFKVSDVVIDILMYTPAPHKDFPRDKITYYKKYMRKLFNSLIEEKDLFIQVRVPTKENAMEEDIDYSVYEDAICAGISIDFNKLKKECVELVDNLSEKKEVTIFTEDENELKFSVENRKWYKDDGTGDIPCGEVYIAPVEESANGTILIPKITLMGRRFSNVFMEFEKGRLIKCSLRELEEFIKKFHGNSDIIGEFGVGLNENIKELIGCNVIDEKCRGTAHIAIGMNEMFGGKNSSDLHMDFVFKPIKIEIDGNVFMEGSKILYLD